MRRGEGPKKHLLWSSSQPYVLTGSRKRMYPRQVQKCKSSRPRKQYWCWGWGKMFAALDCQPLALRDSACFHSLRAQLSKLAAIYLWLIFKNCQPWLLWLVDWVPACEPKGHQFNSQSGHIPGLQARSPVGGAWEATAHWCFSPCLSPSLPLCLKINK